MTFSKTELLQRIENGETTLDGLDLSGQDLSGLEINGSSLMMRGTNFDGAMLRNAKLSQLQLSQSSFQGTNLEEVTFESCIMVRTDLYNASCRGARFLGGWLDCSCLISADMRDCAFHGNDWSEVLLGNTDLRGAILGDIPNLNGCEFAEMPEDIKAKTGLSQMPIHVDMSTIERTADYQRILLKKGLNLSSPVEAYAEFFRKAGIDPAFVAAYQSILERSDQSLQSVFISYSTQDQSFADRLFDALKRHGVKTWYAPKDMKGGQQIHEQIHSAIESYDRVLLILSKGSMASNWVATELAKAYSRESAGGDRVLFPISLTKYDNLAGWELFDADHGTDLARYIRRYYIPDFSDWRDGRVFEERLGKLVDDLRLDDTHA